MIIDGNGLRLEILIFFYIQAANFESLIIPDISIGVSSMLCSIDYFFPLITVAVAAAAAISVIDISMVKLKTDFIRLFTQFRFFFFIDLFVSFKQQTLIK